MSSICKFACGLIVGGCIACAIDHRRVIVACVKGEPLPEPPEWHVKYHPGFAKQQSARRRKIA